MATSHELILGGARSGKSRTAELRAKQWLAADRRHRATLVATALAGDGEMAERIARHRADRAVRVPSLATVEASRDLGAVLRRLDDPSHLLVVDCLTLWLSQALLPPEGATMDLAAWQAEQGAFVRALEASLSPVVMVSNEIGLGVMPLGRETRACVDALGHLHQQLAARCGRVTLMVAGCELPVKDSR